MEPANDQLARNATSRGRLGRRLLGRSWRRFAYSDRRGRDGAAHSRHLKPGSARLLAEGAVSVWRFGSGSGDGVRWHYRRPVPLTTISACRLPQREQTSRSRQSSTGVSAAYRAAISAGSGSTCWPAAPKPRDQSDAGGSAGRTRCDGSALEYPAAQPQGQAAAGSLCLPPAVRPPSGACGWQPP